MPEKGGRYFREARFLFLGDRYVAQSHVPEARVLFGYMRDMQAMGGPPIQVQYATLQDGTKIKAVMMNGQFQAQILSTSSHKEGIEYPPTIVGIHYVTTPDRTTLIYRRGFKWQKKTGVVFLDVPGVNVNCFPESVSEDGALVAGTTAAGTVVWDADNVPTIYPTAANWSIDVSNGSITPFSTLIGIEPSMNVSVDAYHRYLGDGSHLFYGGRVYGANSDIVGTTVRRDTNGAETFGLHEPTGGLPAGYSYVTGATKDGNTLVGEYDAIYVCVWRRTDSQSPYSVVAANSGLRRSASISDDGRLIVAQKYQYRTTGGLYDITPVIWNPDTGTEELVEPFLSPPTNPSPIQYQALGDQCHSKGRHIGGSFNTDPFISICAWEKLPSGLWRRIPELNGPTLSNMFGYCTATN